MVVEKMDLVSIGCFISPNTGPVENNTWTEQLEVGQTTISTAYTAVPEMGSIQFRKCFF